MQPTEEEVYDEFGNLIGGEIESEYSDSEEDIASDVQVEETDAKEEPPANELQLISTSNVQTINLQPYQQPSEQAPVIQPEVIRQIHIDEADLPAINYSREYMHSIMSLPERVRNFAVIGNLHSGKTSFIDNLIAQTHRNFSTSRYMDTHKLERDRETTIKASPITILLSATDSKSHVFNIIDTPGHSNFNDECSAVLEHVEGALLVLDVVEGLTARDKILLDEVISKNKALVIVLNKIDRLLLELRLSPKESRMKLEYALQQTEKYIGDHELAATYSHNKSFSPTHNNVIFASNIGFNFTVQTFSNIYKRKGIKAMELPSRIWDQYYVDGTLTEKPHPNGKGAFEAFVLEPLYKVITHTLTSENLGKLLWDGFGVKLRKAQYKQDTPELLRGVMNAIFPDSAGLVESVAKSIPIPSGSETNAGGDSSQLYCSIIKLIETSDASSFLALVRVHNGTLTTEASIKVVGENFIEDDEDFKITTIDSIYLPGGRYKVQVDHATAGSIVLVSGVDLTVVKSGTIVDRDAGLAAIRDRLSTRHKMDKKSVLKVAIAPANPKDLPQLLTGLRNATKSYLSSIVNVEESGEIVLTAPGELYLDCMLHDLRTFFAPDVEIKVSDPMARFGETVIDTSITKITTSMGSNSLSIISEPIEDQKLSQSIEMGILNLSQPIKTTAKILRDDFGWDALAARSVWYFGAADLTSPCILIDDTLEEEGTDKQKLNLVKEPIIQGYKWCANEGPLCGEPVRNTKFKILDAVLNDVHSSSSQLIPLTRRACYSGFLCATPRLMEPIYGVYITTTERCIHVISKLLSDRRGFLLTTSTIPMTNLVEVKGTIPVIESAGFETEVLFHTQGGADVFLDFEKWDVVPGDPLDDECDLPALSPVPEESLARDFMLKTRRRKGLGDEVTLRKYVDAEVYEGLKSNGFVR